MSKRALSAGASQGSSSQPPVAQRSLTIGEDETEEEKSKSDGEEEEYIEITFRMRVPRVVRPLNATATLSRTLVPHRVVIDIPDLPPA